MTTLDLNLVVAQRTRKVLDIASLRPDAAAILKGVWRSEMVPFFERLSAEGLWDETATWKSLDDSARATFLNGFWIRPGHGTFLNGRKFDGSEVGHWLRWDGLISAISSQLGRSKDASWQDKVTASQGTTRCPTCGGTGLGLSAKLVVLGNRTFFGWVSDGSLKDFLIALEKVPAAPARAEGTRARIIRCLKPLMSSNPRLRETVPPLAARPVWSRAALEFTGMPLAAE